MISTFRPLLAEVNLWKHIWRMIWGAKWSAGFKKEIQEDTMKRIHTCASTLNIIRMRSWSISCKKEWTRWNNSLCPKIFSEKRQTPKFLRKKLWERIKRRMLIANTRRADIMRKACVVPATTEISNLKPFLCASTVKRRIMPRACASVATIVNAKTIEHAVSIIH